MRDGWHLWCHSDGLVCNPTFSSCGSGGAVSPQRGPGHFGKNLLRINLKSGLFSVAVYTPNSDPISDVHWLVRRKIGSAVRGCAKLVDIRTWIENDRLVTSLVYCAIYAQLLVLRALGGASHRTGSILVVVRMAAPPATTSSALAWLAHLVHRQWFIMHPWTRVDRWGTGGGTRLDAINTRLCRLRRLTTNVG